MCLLPVSCIENNCKGVKSGVPAGHKQTFFYSFKVRFSKDLEEVHHMVQWAFAYQAARRGPWEEYARDRERFKKRIAETEKSLKWVLQPSHRTKIYTERFD